MRGSSARRDDPIEKERLLFSFFFFQTLESSVEENALPFETSHSIVYLAVSKLTNKTFQVSCARGSTLSKL